MSSPEIDSLKQTYRLKRYPYEVRELDPLRDASDLDWVSWVDGWQQARELEAFLEARATAGEPALVVVAGRSGTGRSSLANWLIHTWAQKRGMSAADVVVVRRKAANGHAEEQLWKWSLDSEAKVVGAGLALSDTTNDALKGLLEKKPEALAASVRRYLQRLVLDLHLSGRGFAGVVGRLEDPEYLTLAAECISEVNALMVLTVVVTPATESAVIGEQDKLLDPSVGRLVQLRELSAKEVTKLVQERWRLGAGALDHPSPFSDAGLEAAFDKPRSVREIFQLMTALLVTKTAGAKAQSWPDDQDLGFDDDEIAKRVPYLNPGWPS